MLLFFQTAYRWMYEELAFSPALQFLSWVIFPLVFINFSTGFVHIVGPNAIGKHSNLLCIDIVVFVSFMRNAIFEVDGSKRNGLVESCSCVRCRHCCCCHHHHDMNSTHSSALSVSRPFHHNACQQAGRQAGCPWLRTSKSLCSSEKSRLYGFMKKFYHSFWGRRKNLGRNFAFGFLYFQGLAFLK